MKNLTLHSFNRAILHIDGDNFFVSCELAKRPSLRGKPVVTGKERGIATAMSKEAKALGITRGMPVAKIKKLFPETTIIASDYESYTLYSKRMYEIVRRYTPHVEEYSIDECFADITGFRKYHGMSYEDIAAKIQEDLVNELGISFSIGLSVNKMLSKLASNFEKPHGLTIIPRHSINIYLAKIGIEKVWGVGRSTRELLKRMGIDTASQFAALDEKSIREMYKPQIEMWKELRGDAVYELNTETKHEYQSISRTRTFEHPSSLRPVVFSQLSKNIEEACTKLRAHGLVTKSVFFYIKTQDMKTQGVELKFSIPTCLPQDIINAVQAQFDEIYDSRKLYRATGIVLMKLTPEESVQLDLFGKTLQVKEISTIYQHIDKITQKFGRKGLFLASSMDPIKKATKHLTSPLSSATESAAKNLLLKKRLNVISLGKVK